MGNCCDCFKTNTEEVNARSSEITPLLSSKRTRDDVTATTTSHNTTTTFTGQLEEKARIDSPSQEDSRSLHSDSYNTNRETEERVTAENNREDVSEWKAYLHRIKNQDGAYGSGDDDGSGDVSSDGSSSLVDLSGALEESCAEDDIPGYFLYVTGEGMKIWILADKGTEGVEINDNDVEQLMNRSDVSDGSAPVDGGESGFTDTFAPFHLSKAEALANVARMRTLSACAASYEAALKTQQVCEAKKREAMRAQTMTELGVGGMEATLSVAERKKRLWDSSGKLARGQTDK